MRRSTLAALCAATLLSTLAPAAQAAPTWLAPVGLAPDGSAPAVAIGSAGDVAAVYARAGGIQARVRAPGGSFGEPQALFGEGASTAPDIAIADDGTAVAAWGFGGTVQFSARAPGGAFSAPQPLPADSGGGAVTALDVAMNGRGDAVIAYVRGGVFAASRSPGGTFGNPVRVSGAEACEPRAALGASGHAAVAWREGCGPTGGGGRVARRAPDGAFPAEAEVLGQALAIAVAVTGDGTTGVALERAGAVLASTGAASAAMAPPGRISVDGEAAEAPAIATEGAALVAAFRSAGRVVAAVRAPGASFGSPAAVSEPGVASGSTRLAAGSAGTTAVWLRDREGISVAESAHQSPGAAFTPPVAVSAVESAATGLALAADSDGNAVVGFAQPGPVARVLDAAGPQLRGIEMRSAGFAAEEYAFSVTPVDAWSAVASSAFDFGEGTSRSGPTATYAFRNAGPHTVTVSATDSVGNTARALRPFDVSPALDRTPPVITKARLDAARFVAAGRPTAVTAQRRRRGTRFRYTLSEPAQATIFFERVLLGRKRGKRCRRSARRGKRCRIYRPEGLLTRTHPVAGRVSVAFSGRLVASNGPIKLIDKRFTRGRYRATIVASDALRNVSKPVQLAFTVIR